MNTYGYLAHHGVKGQKWGIRRYQNKDGSLTAEGKEKYLSYGRKHKHLSKTKEGKYKLTSFGANYVNGAMSSLKTYKPNDNITLEKYAKAVKTYKKAGAILTGTLLGTTAFGVYNIVKGNKEIKDAEKNYKDFSDAWKWRNDEGYGSYEEMDDEYFRRKNMKYPAVVHSELYHHGVKGQKWGVRRYQNADGSLTAEGRARYGISTYDKNVSYKDVSNEIKNSNKIALRERNYDLYNTRRDKTLSPEEKRKRLQDINNQYKGTGQVILNEYKKKYGDKTIKTMGNLEIAQRLAYIPAGLTLLGAGAYATKRIVDDFSVVREDDRRYYDLKKYSPGEVLKYEMF